MSAGIIPTHPPCDSLLCPCWAAGQSDLIEAIKVARRLGLPTPYLDESEVEP